MIRINVVLIEVSQLTDLYPSMQYIPWHAIFVDMRFSLKWKTG